MRKFFTCLCIFTICLGIFTGCADNRVPQPDEGTTEFLDLDAYLQELQEEGIPVPGTVEYKEIESLVKSALSTAGISTNFEFVASNTGGKPLSETKFFEAYGKVSGKPLVINYTLHDGNWELISVRAPEKNGIYYWFPPNPNRTKPAYDFYTGKELSSTDSSQG